MKNSSHFSKVLYNNALHWSKVSGTFNRFYRMGLRVGALSKTIEPGQFFTVRCSDGMNPILRRPFGVHRIKGKGVLEILYKVVGPATELLSKKKAGDKLDIIGPLGNGFPLPSHQTSTPRVAGRGTTILVAGGHGIAPLLELARRLTSSVVFMGAKSEKDIVCERDFQKLGAEVHIATEDGSKGYKGLVTDLLKTFLRTTNHERRTTNHENEVLSRKRLL